MLKLSVLRWVVIKMLTSLVDFHRGDVRVALKVDGGGRGGPSQPPDFWEPGARESRRRRSGRSRGDGQGDDGFGVGLVLAAFGVVVAVAVVVAAVARLHLDLEPAGEVADDEGCVAQAHEDGQGPADGAGGHVHGDGRLAVLHLDLAAWGAGLVAVAAAAVLAGGPATAGFADDDVEEPGGCGGDALRPAHRGHRERVAVPVSGANESLKNIVYLNFLRAGKRK